jgi:site-specific DNA-methyltransferase (adenine-specific)
MFVVNDIIQADSKELSKYVKPNSVALTITSPPYRNAINYSQHVKNLKTSKNARFRGDVGISTKEYLDEMEKIFSEVLKVTIPGGFCCIVIGDEVVNGKLIPLQSLLISRLVKEEENPDGWHLRDVLIWNKVTAGRNGAGNRFGIFIQHSVPTYYRANIMHEYIIVLEKGVQRREIDRTTTKKLPLNRAMKRQVSLSIWDLPVDEAVLNESKKSIWDMTPVPPRVIDHPAVFPEQIPWRLINLYSKEGDVILDPMNGSGQTTKVAHQLGRNYIGIDKRLPYVKLAKRRLTEPFLLSNFMTPVYLPIAWTDGEESGKKDDAHLDISKVPKGFKFIFSKKSSKEVLGVRGNYLYYKNDKGDWICYIIDRSSRPTKINVGNFSNSKSPLRVVLSLLPNTTFHKAQLNKLLPPRLVENRQPIRAVIDVLEHEQFLRKTGTKIGTGELYEVIIPKKHRQITAQLSKIHLQRIKKIKQAHDRKTT